MLSSFTLKQLRMLNTEEHYRPHRRYSERLRHPHEQIPRGLGTVP